MDNTEKLIQQEIKGTSEEKDSNKKETELNTQESYDVLEKQYNEISLKIEDSKIPEGVIDDNLKKSFLEEKKQLSSQLAQKKHSFVSKLFSVFDRKKTLSEDTKKEYEKYLEEKEADLLKGRVFYEGQDIENPKKSFWTKDLQKHKDFIFGMKGSTGEYLDAIASLDETSPFSILAKKIKEIGDINNVRFYTSKSHSGYGGAFINVNSEIFDIADGTKKPKQAFLKKYVELFGAERYFVQTTLHECIHALVLSKINSPKSQRDRLIADQLYTVFNEVKKNTPEFKKTQYGFTNLDEFLAEFFTSAEFRNTVSGVNINREKLDKNYSENQEWGGFIRIKIRNLIELVLNKENPSDKVSLEGVSDTLVRDLVEELLGSDIFVEGLNDSLETQGIIDLSKSKV